VIFSGHPLLPVVGFFALGTYRDTFSGSTQKTHAFSKSTTAGSTFVHEGVSGITNAYAAEEDTPIATAVTTSSTTGTGTLHGKAFVSDPILHKLPRHLTEPWAEWLFVGKNGHLSHILAKPEEQAVILKSWVA
jgi:hypothetical protein